MRAASTWRGIAIGLAAAALLPLAACGGDDDSASDPPSTTTTTEATDQPSTPSAGGGGFDESLCPTIARMEEITGVSGLDQYPALVIDRPLVPAPEGTLGIECEYPTPEGTQALSFEVYRLPDDAAASAYLLALTSRNCPDPAPASGIGDEALQACGPYDPANASTVNVRVGRDVYAMGLVTVQRAIPVSVVEELISEITAATGAG